MCASLDKTTAQFTEVATVHPRGGSHGDLRSATADARAVEKRIAIGRSSGRQADGGVGCRADDGGAAEPVARGEGRGKRQFHRPRTQSAQQQLQAPSEFLTAVLPSGLKVAHEIPVSVVLAAARCLRTTTWLFPGLDRKALAAGGHHPPPSRLGALDLDSRRPDE